MELAERLFGIVDEQALGDLKLQSRGRKPGLAQDAGDGLGHIGAPKLGRRKIVRHRQMLAPGDGIAAGAAQHPFAERHDQAGFLRHRDEVGRRHFAMHRMMPANQRFDSGLLAGGKIELRLIDDLEFLAAESEAQIVHDRASALQGLVHAFLEEAHALTAIGLGAGKRNIGVPQQFRGGVAVIRGERDTGAHGAHELLIDNANGAAPRPGGL